MARLPSSLQERQNKLNRLLKELEKITMIYSDKKTPSNKIKLLNIQNSIRQERVRVKKAMLDTNSDQ